MTVAMPDPGRAKVVRRPSIGVTVPGAIGLALVVLVVGATVFAPWVAPYAPNAQDLYNLYAPPSLQSGHLLGTDGIGQDLLSRIIHGGRMPLIIAGSACLLSAIVGVGLGWSLAHGAAGSTRCLAASPIFSSPCRP